jgi:hypothetical protein
MISKKGLQIWKMKFREYVRTHDSLELQDNEGNKIAFDLGEPMWLEDNVITGFGDSISVEVEMDGLVDKTDENRIVVWLRRFAASMGRFGVKVDITKNESKGSYYSVFASMDIPEMSKRSKKSRSHVFRDNDDFWIIGDPTIGQFQFMMIEDRGYYGDVCETTDDPLSADRYNTYKEAEDALCTQEDIIEWARGTPFPSRVRPLKVDVKVTVK